jgi:hypothetical protein
MKTKINTKLETILNNINKNYNATAEDLYYTTDFNTFTKEPVKGLTNYIGILKDGKDIEAYNLNGMSQYVWFYGKGIFFEPDDLFTTSAKAEYNADVRHEKKKDTWCFRAGKMVYKYLQNNINEPLIKNPGYELECPEQEQNKDNKGLSMTATTKAKPTPKPVTIFKSIEVIKSESKPLTSTPHNSTMNTPLLNIETAISNIEETLEDLTLHYSDALNINENLKTLREALHALEYIQSTRVNSQVEVGIDELTEQEQQVASQYPYLQRRQDISLNLQEGRIYQYLLEKVLENKATSNQTFLLQHIQNGNHLKFSDSDRFTSYEIQHTVNRIAHENSRLLESLYLMQC